ncbi:hypothetical protein [Candidatus Phytoplasma pyri]|uniref:hypothetical protein n=1 Tax=Candidatus Phytoplasma pyri TaxID=47566 RepID=UPI0039838186
MVTINLRQIVFFIGVFVIVMLGYLWVANDLTPQKVLKIISREARTTEEVKKVDTKKDDKGDK